jgi:hypothetical protein
MAGDSAGRLTPALADSLLPFARTERVLRNPASGQAGKAGPELGIRELRHEPFGVRIEPLCGGQLVIRALATFASFRGTAKLMASPRVHPMFEDSAVDGPHGLVKGIPAVPASGLPAETAGE